MGVVCRDNLTNILLSRFFLRPEHTPGAAAGLGVG